mmetsp:Transcript_32367/g.62210  ORF Transcript_32367/g.62210 Transcript_32367/m.62210 type:complete len:223 (-) Transcript_32367:40-708(-)
MCIRASARVVNSSARLWAALPPKPLAAMRLTAEGWVMRLADAALREAASPACRPPASLGDVSRKAARRSATCMASTCARSTATASNLHLTQRDTHTPSGLTGAASLPAGTGSLHFLTTWISSLQLSSAAVAAPPTPEPGASADAPSSSRPITSSVAASPNKRNASELSGAARPLSSLWSSALSLALWFGAGVSPPSGCDMGGRHASRHAQSSARCLKLSIGL